MSYETNSKLVKNGDVFVALKGNYHDGHDYINEAIKNGASLVICEKKLDLIVKYKKVKSTHKYLTKVLSKENNKLTRNMKIIGITGTKGKTTTAMIVYDFLKKLKINAAYIGTLGVFYKDEHFDLDNTTPDIMTLNKILKILKENEVTHIVMEVSSHALNEERIKGLYFESAVFTNISQDHLDYHKTMKEYFKAKLKILKHLDGNIIINIDDISGKKISKKTKRYISVGKNGSFNITDYKLFPTNSIVTFEYHYNYYTLSIPFVGKHNIYNYTEAIALLTDLGFELNDLINLTNSLKPIRGRNELIKANNGYIVIDYAHSPASVEETLKTYNELKKGKIITIIGCGGNRDKSKRPIMGKIALEKSDYVIFTSDNPRDEDPKEIIKEMTNNLSSNNYEVIIDRKKAIKKGVKLLKKDDYLLILGKGHETYQIIKNQKYHFDDKEEVLRIIS
ncbi:MAG: UDP-N-acetylmuramoyl-L-alanyl-D-glutamate--2,6-diaminopimelate ligase [Bacilli bacterium]|nr:UDP-N-acetylmuramoyl-L-alanyl-D-glutamate--2,6-diaminopimelate ligase [Bacilli bacterium]